MNVKLLTEHHLEFLSLKGGCTGSSESAHLKMPHCWKSHAVAQIFSVDLYIIFGKRRNLCRLLVMKVNGPRREKTCLRGLRKK